MIPTVTNKKTPTLNSFNIRGFAIPPHTKPIKNLINGAHLAKKPHLKHTFEISSKEFEVKFNLEFDKSKVIISSKHLSFPLHFNENILTATFKGKLDEKDFITESFFLDLQKQGKTPVSAFLLSTLSSIIRLSKSFDVSIPIFNYKLNSTLDSSVSEINEFLLGRNQAYKLMVIEKAAKVKLNLTAFDSITETDLMEIDYSFQSITKRNFEIIANHKEPLGTNKEENITSEIFGHKVNLGIQKLIFGNNKINVESITTPTLPKNAFNKEIQKLIDLEEKLIDAIFEKYLNSFSNAFEGLSDEQIESITERPTLEEEAFNF